MMVAGMDGREAKGSSGERALCCLLGLMGCALNGLAPSAELAADAEDELVLRLARRHSVAALAASALMRAGDPAPEWKAEYDESSLRQALMGVDREAVLAGLEGLGIRYVVLKGIVRGGDTIVNFVGGRNMGMAAVDGRLLPFMIHGTGDLYASSLLAAIMCGHGLVDAAGFAGTFVRKAMEVTRRQPDYQMRGVSFETVLGDVTALVG